jgi:hypothetical protein
MRQKRNILITIIKWSLRGLILIEKNIHWTLNIWQAFGKTNYTGKQSPYFPEAYGQIDKIRYSDGRNHTIGAYGKCQLKDVLAFLYNWFIILADTE